MLSLPTTPSQSCSLCLALSGCKVPGWADLGEGLSVSCQLSDFSDLLTGGMELFVGQPV